MPRILLVTGEASGDLHGAHLAAAIVAQDPTVEVVGIGGAAMRAAGVTLIPNVPQLDVMGLIGLSAVRTWIGRLRAVRRILRSEPWDLVVFIDNPGLNLHFARVAKAAGRRVLYYIAPQVWAWRPGRMKWIRRRVDHVVVILPFEARLYERAGVRCTFVGHPLLDSVALHYDKTALRRRYQLRESAPVVGLLPGSRAAEVTMLLPLLLETAAQTAAREPATQFLVAQAASIDDHLLNRLLEDSPVRVQIVKDQASEVMAASDLLVVASGTATLQAAVIGTPMILVYKTTLPTYWVARLLIRVKWIGLVNLVAARTIVPELIQDEANAERLIGEVRALLNDREAYNRMKDGLREVRHALGEPGASRRAARVVLEECRA
jgi:lipid-A-disaccharide synthase